MGVLDKLKGAFGIDDEDEFDEDELEVEEAEETPADNTFKPDFTQQVRTSAPEMKVNKPEVKPMSLSSKLQVSLVKPEGFERASEIADSLMSGKTVVLNLESTNKDAARRLVDFLSGVAYAKSGNVQKIANMTYLITPYNIDFSGENIMESEARVSFDDQGVIY